MTYFLRDIKGNKFTFKQVSEETRAKINKTLKSNSNYKVL